MKLVLFFLFIAGFGAWAQEVPPPTEVSTETPPTDSVGVIIDPAVNLKKPLGRVKSTTEVNPESSSLNTDPDNIDPLNPLRENLKDDDEPVLEDIKQILNAPKVIKKEEKLTEVVSGDATKTETMTTTTTTDNQTSRVKKNKVAKKNKFKKKKEVISLNPDEADLNLEKKFNDTYKSYNINPTSDESWALATSKQTARLYVVQKGDTLWSISNLLFGDPNYWPKIWSLNKQGILNPHFIQPGSKIYFYMGDEDNAPTLSVGEASNTNVTNNYDKSANDKTPFKASLPNKIPKSMPLSRNEKYFVDKKPDEFRIELTEFPRFDPEYISDIVITDLPLKTEVQIQINETARFRCYDGRIIRDIKFMEKISEDYDIYEPLDQFKTKAGVLNAYRFYGYAKPYQLKNLIITSCKSLLVTDLILLPKDKIQTLRSRKISPMKTPVLIGGPNVVSQRLFVPQQIAYVDFGSTSFELGQNFNVMSQVTDSINGQIKIIDKYGSFAVVIVTDVNDVIEIGDKVIN